MRKYINAMMNVFGAAFAVLTLFAAAAWPLLATSHNPREYGLGRITYAQNADKQFERLRGELFSVCEEVENLKENTASSVETAAQRDSHVPVEYVIYPPPDDAAPFEPLPEADAEMLARFIWGEARGVPSMMERAAVVWCVLNRMDSPEYPDTIAEVVTQEGQFNGYSPENPSTGEHMSLAADVYYRWRLEKAGAAESGRVLPACYVFFTGYDGRNHFRSAYRGGNVWDWSLWNPYED